MLRDLPIITDPKVLVGHSSRDDAGVYLLNESTALVVTTDFFTPVVDEALDFGRVAAANALSDIWACGAKPLFALNIVGFPRSLPMELLGEILQGGGEIASEAGISIIGGHSIDDPEPKYGLVVIGVVHPDRLLRNDGAREGDTLILTKPLGSGVITTALKRGVLSDEQRDEVVELMTRLNRAAGEVFAANFASVNALTDVTGFGLLGHLFEMLEGAELSATLDLSRVPILESARELAAQGVAPGGSRANLRHVAERVDFGGCEESVQLLLADAQTSGGLLAAVSADGLDEVRAALELAGVEYHEIGRFEAGPPGVRVVEGS